MHLDVTVEESVKHSIAYMVDSFGRMDYCIHCAGVSLSSFVAEFTYKITETTSLD